MKTHRGMLYATAAVVLVGGSVLALGAHQWNEDANDEQKMAALDQNGTEKMAGDTSSSADPGVEQYRGGHFGGGRGGGHWGGGGGHWGGGRGHWGGGGGHWGGGEHWGGGRGWGGRGWGRGWGDHDGDRGWGWGGRRWGHAWGYRDGRWGYYGPSYYGYTCDDGWWYCW